MFRDEKRKEKRREGIFVEIKKRTWWLVQVVVLLAHELVLVEEVDALASGDRLSAHATLEAVDVKDLVVVGTPHQVGRSDSLIAARTLLSESP